MDATWSAVHRLDDGGAVRLRLLQPSDRERLRAGFARLSPAARYNRFLSAMPKLSDRMLDYLTRCDGWDHVAVGAEAVAADGGAGDGLGVARFIRLADEPTVAEAAVAVVDDAQRRGIGRLLLSALVAAARERDIVAFRAYLAPTNDSARSFIGELTGPAAAVHRESGMLVYDLPLVATAEPEAPPSDTLLYRFFRAAAAGLQVVARAFVQPDPPDARPAKRARGEP
jgi:GNAT superfamily N-acetyltransferase